MPAGEVWQPCPMDLRSFGLGLLVGGAAVGTVGLGGYLAVEALDTDSGDVTADEVLLSAMRGFVDAHGIPVGSDIASTVEFGGTACGGVVEIDATGLREVYIVRQDSGDALPAEVTEVSLAEAKRALARGDERCF